MKFTCKKKEFSKALTIVSRAVDSNPSLEVLKNILIVAENKKISFTATNLDIFISFAIEANIKNEGQITIPAKILTDYVNLIAEEDLEIESTESLSLGIKTTSSKTKIKGIAPEEFPSIPKVEKGNIFEVSSANFIEAVNQTSFVASADDARPILSGIFFDIQKDSLKMVATDSYRLAEKKIKLAKKSEEDFSAVVLSKTIREIARIAGKFSEEEKITANIQKGKFVNFSIAGVEFISRLVEGRYPDYEQIIPKKQNSTVQVDLEELVRSVKRINIFAKEAKNSVNIDVRKGGMIYLNTDATEVGEGYAEVPAKKVDGENITVSLNADFLLEALNAIPTDGAKIEIESKEKPVVIKPDSKKQDYVHIIMPLKV